MRYAGFFAWSLRLLILTLYKIVAWKDISVRTTFVRLSRSVELGEQIDGWPVFWLGGLDKDGIAFFVIVARETAQGFSEKVKTRQRQVPPSRVSMRFVRLDVAVRHSRPMRTVQSVGDLRAVGERES